MNHEGGERRVVLIVDCWHPALRPAERVLIRDLFRALDLPKR